MGFRILQISDCTKLSLRLNNLIIKSNGEEYSIYIKDIDTVIIEDFRTVITTRIITALTDQNINIIFCNEKYEPSSYVLPIHGNFNINKVVKSQISWDENAIGHAWKIVVEAKIKNQIECLRITDRRERISELIELLKDIQLLDSTNREGHAAKIYFHSLFNLKFKRHSETAQNYALNYGYTVLRGLVVRTICAKGLLPYISLFHSSQGNYFALADDLMEPFRPLVDLFVKKHIDESSEILRKVDRDNLIKLMTENFTIEGKEVSLSYAINKYIGAIVEFMETGVISNEMYPKLRDLRNDYEV